MKAIVYEHYGSPEVLHITDVATPNPRDNQVLVKIRATTVTVGDTIMRSFNIPGQRWQRIPARLILGIWKPRKPILGMELAGDVMTVGKNVTRYKVGDPVLASTFSVGFGGYAEYICLPEDGMMAHKPGNLSYGEAAAAVGGGMTALRILRKADIQPGQHVLIYGASGAVGTNAVQIARHHFGAYVTGVCSATNLSLVRSLGAHEIIDYTQEDFTERPETHDVIFDAVGKLDAQHGKQVLKPDGLYLNVHKDSGRGEKKEELLALVDLLTTSKVKPAIDRYYPFEEIVAAHHYVDKGHKKGNVVITVA